jgi:hypothetical protein
MGGVSELVPMMNRGGRKRRVSETSMVRWRRRPAIHMCTDTSQYSCQDGEDDEYGCSGGNKRRNRCSSPRWEDLLGEAGEVNAKSVTADLEYMWMDGRAGDALFSSVLTSMFG